MERKKQIQAIITLIIVFNIIVISGSIVIFFLRYRIEYYSAQYRPRALEDQPQWNYTWGGVTYDRGNKIALDTLGNAYVAGYTNSYGAGNTDHCLVKFNSAGSMVWNYTWGGPDDDWGYDIALDALGNAYICGYTDSYGALGFDLCLVKFNSAGVVWNYTWGGSGDDRGYGIALDAVGNAYVAGHTTSYGALGYDICLVKFNSTGVVWNYTWGGFGDDRGYGIAMDAVGNAYVAGHTTSYGALGYDICLVKFNSTGVERYYTWGGTGTDYGNNIALDAGGNAYVCGYTTSYGAIDDDLCLVKFNSTGAERYYMWGGAGEDQGHGVALDAGGNAYVTGHTYSYGALSEDLCLVKFNSAGVVWNYTWGGSGIDVGYGIALDAVGNAYITGLTTSYGTGWEMWLIKVKIGDVVPLPFPFEIIVILIIINCLILGIGLVGNHLKKIRDEKKADSLYQEISQRPESLTELLPPEPIATERSTSEIRSPTSIAAETSKPDSPPLMPSTTEKGKPVKIPKKKPSKKRTSTNEMGGELTPEELDELKKTITEVGVEELKIICVVHKGPVEGNIYLCPNCKTFYCVRCATTLKERGEKCWTCSNELKV